MNKDMKRFGFDLIVAAVLGVAPVVAAFAKGAYDKVEKAAGSNAK